MLLDGVVRNRGAISVPWQEYRREANSLFRFRLVFGLISLFLLVLILAACLAVLLLEGPAAAPSIRLVILMACALALFAWLAATVLISMLLFDFVVPVMLRDRLPVLAAWRRVLEGLLWPHPGSVALYVVARFLLQVLIGVLALMAVLLACCLASLPYLGSVILWRSWGPTGSCYPRSVRLPLRSDRGCAQRCLLADPGSGARRDRQTGRRDRMISAVSSPQGFSHEHRRPGLAHHRP